METNIDLSQYNREILNALINEAVAQYVMKYEKEAERISLIERVIRVEEELKSLREVQNSILREMNARFEALQSEMNARFEAIQSEMNARFEAMDKRFETLTKFMFALKLPIIGLLFALVFKAFF